ncbi:PilZ domain-containing protein [Spirochaetia bacterium 38H-sp]|uniref:PilZ domain-containing protein n=1 Tax=Rarispira pelagica TaxID=3141764 RepID=A0ABU9UBW5_9SPIR
MNHEKRSVERDIIYCKALFTDKEIPSYLRDISLLGCRIDIVNPIQTQIGDKHIIKLFPLEETGIPFFSVSAEVRWIKNGSDFLTLGLRFFDVPIENTLRLKKLVEFIHNHNKDQ